MITTESMYQEIGIRPEVLSFGSKIETALKERFDRIDETEGSFWKERILQN